jgi:probable HAF family extracellular repeat protein
MGRSLRGARRGVRRSVTGLVLLATSAFLLTGCATDLGTLGGTESHALDVGRDGVIVGHSLTAGGFDHAFVYRPEVGRMVDLGAPGGAFSKATAISDDGTIAGYVVTGSYREVAWLWRPDGSGAPLPVSGFDYGVPLGAASNGSFAGYVGNHATSNVLQGAVWDPDGKLHTFGPLSRFGEVTRAVDVNRHGQAVGIANAYRECVCGSTGAFLWDPVNGLRALPTNPLVNAVAEGINDAGDIVGSAWHPFYYDRVPVRWRPDTLEIEMLPDLSPTPHQDAELRDVNNDAMAVGWAEPEGTQPDDPTRHAYCVSLRTGKVTDLGPGEATAINDAGVIVGTRDNHATRWSADSCSH